MLSLILVITLSAGAPSPEKAVAEFFKEFDAGNYQNAWNLVTPNSATYLENCLANMHAMSNKYSKEPTALPKGGEILASFGKDLKGKINLMPDEILGSIVKQNHGYVVVKYDLERLMDQALAGSNQAAMAKSFLNQLPSKTIVWTWEASKEKDGWMFDLGIINMGVSIFSNFFGMMSPIMEPPTTTEVKTGEGKQPNQ